MRQLEREFNSTDLAVAVAHAPDPAIAGSPVVYSVVVTNNGPNPADDAVVQVTLPAEVSVDETNAPCTPGPGGVHGCDLDSIDVGASQTVTLTTTVDADALGEITSTARVENQIGDELDPSNDESMSTMAAIVPIEPLDSGAQYTATMTIIWDGEEETFTATFTTQ